MLDRSNVFNELAEGRGPEVNFSINGHEYKMRYYLADGIYISFLLQPLLKLFQLLNVVTESILVPHKRQLGKTLSKHLECCNLDFQ